MYEFLSKISQFLSEPFADVVFSSNIAIVTAIFLGFIGSVAPCQISANAAAITYFGNRQFQGALSWVEIVLYLLGKVLVFSLLGLLFWLLGQQLSQTSIPVFSLSRKLLGPLFIVMGLFLLGWIKLPFQIGLRISHALQTYSRQQRGGSSAFLLGVAFSLGFCPTMFSLFFGLLMPLSLQSTYGFILPPIFAIGTAMPFLLFAGLAVGFGLNRMMIKKSKIWGKWIQIIAGVIFIVFGVIDTMTYWSL